MKLPVLKPGKYIVAVSGGVDSMVLLDLVAKEPELELVVAHFDHGIRPDSKKDAQLVAEVAGGLAMAFEVGYGNLGADASEAEARNARYKFLNNIKDKHHARAIITAHHQDDLIETVFINILRGTGPVGLASLKSRDELKRPLLKWTKKDIKDYAKAHDLRWREDSSNKDERYLRNYLRLNIIPKLSQKNREDIIAATENIAKALPMKEEIIATLSHNLFEDNSLNRAKFALLPSDIANELLTDWLRKNGFRDFDKKLINRLNIAIKTGQPNGRHSVMRGLNLLIEKSVVKLETNP